MQPPAPRRVLYCEGNTDGTIGGSYFSLLYLVQGLKGTRYQPVVAFHQDHALLPRFAECCAQVHVIDKPSPFSFLRSVSPRRRRLPVLSAPVLILQRAVNLARFLATVLAYAGFMRRQRIALLHLNNSVTRAHDWMLAAWIGRTPCVVHERGINARFPLLARLLAPRLSAVVCISEAVRCNLLEHRVTIGNLHVIHNGLDPADVAPRRTADEVRRSLGAAGRGRIIGLIGNIREWKGQEVVVRALPAILAKVPDVACLFVGAATESDRPYADRLRGLIARLSIEERVIFTGYTENVADFLNVIEVPIHASIAPEPFGRVLLEAMAMRKPVVGSRGGAVPEIVEHGVTGYTFAPGDADELAERVTDLLENRDTARAFGEAGYARLVEHFGISRNVSKTLSLYDEVLKVAATPEPDGVAGLGSRAG